VRFLQRGIFCRGPLQRFDPCVVLGSFFVEASKLE
jgi:hypothetical protein